MNTEAAIHNLAELVQRGARAGSDRPAISRGREVVLDYRQLADRSARVAAALVARGLERGDRVALVLENRVEFYELLLGIWHAGLTAVPIMPRLPGDDVAWIVDHAGASLCIAEPGLLARDGIALDEADLIEVGGARFAEFLAHEPIPMRCHPDGADAIAWLFYTSGTTGRPKGVSLSHGNLGALIESYIEEIDRPQPGQSIIHVTPLTHGSGMAGLPHLLCGANQVFPEASSGPALLEEVLDLIERWPGATLILSPAVVDILARRVAREPERVASLRAIIYGSAPMFPRDLERALESFGPKLVQLYGLGESPMAVMLGREDHLRYMASFRGQSLDAGRGRPLPVGRARPGMELRVVDRAGEDRPAGQIGEVLLRGPSMMRGYWNDAEASAATLRHGWLHTGDLGWLDEDGLLYLAGRARDTLQRASGPIHPREIELHLLEFPALREVAVVGRGPEQELVAFVCLEPDAPLEQADLTAHCDRLAPALRPDAFVFVDALPRNACGKVLERVLREGA